jgi:alpha-glucosidase
MLLLTLRGTPTLYYGDELGLENVPIPPDRVQDPWEKNEPGLGLGRDPARTPMPWDRSDNAGFTAGIPWLPFNADHTTSNMASLAADPHSMLSLYRRLIALRRERSALHSGTYVASRTEGDVMVFERRHEREHSLLVALNLGGSPQCLMLPVDAKDARVLLSTALDRDGEVVQPVLNLRPAEGVILELSRIG